MSNRLDEKLQITALKQPPPALRQKVISEAKIRIRSQHFWRKLTIAAAAAALLIIVVNMAVCKPYIRNVVQYPIASSPSIDTAQKLTPATQNIRERERIITSHLAGNGNGYGTQNSLDNLSETTPKRQFPNSSLTLPSVDTLLQRSWYISAGGTPECAPED